MGDRLSCWDECKLPQLNLFSSSRWGLSFCFHDKGSVLKLLAGNEFRKHVSIFAEKTTFGVGKKANSPAQDWNKRRFLKPHMQVHCCTGNEPNPTFSFGVNLMLLFSRLRLASLKVSNSNLLKQPLLWVRSVLSNICIKSCDRGLYNFCDKSCDTLGLLNQE